MWDFRCKLLAALFKKLCAFLVATNVGRQLRAKIRKVAMLLTDVFDHAPGDGTDERHEQGLNVVERSRIEGGRGYC